MFWGLSLFAHSLLLRDVPFQIASGFLGQQAHLVVSAAMGLNNRVNLLSNSHAVKKCGDGDDVN